MNKLLDKIAYWYFSKKSLPYWGMYIIDSIIVLLSGLFSLWFLNRDVLLNANSNTIVASILFYIAISWIGALAFRTYLGIVRHQQFSDLKKILFVYTCTVHRRCPVNKIMCLICKEYILALGAFAKISSKFYPRIKYIIVVTYYAIHIKMWNKSIFYQL